MLAACAVLLAARGASATSRPFHAYDPEQLPDPSVEAIAQDSDGFVWLGTQQGVAVLDGRTHVALPTPPAFRDPFVLDILTADGGIVAVVFPAGVAWYRDRALVGTTTARELGVERLTCGVSAGRDVLLGTWQPGRVLRVRFDGAVRTEIVESVAPAVQSGVSTLASLGPDRWMAGTVHEGFVTFDAAGVLSAKGPAEGLPKDAIVTALVGDAQGRVLVGTDRGLYRDEGSALVLVPLSFGHAPVTDLHRHTNGTVLVGTEMGAVYALAGDGEPRLVFRGPSAVPRFRFAETPDETTWVTFGEHGLLRIDASLTRGELLTVERGLPSSTVHAVFVESSGTLLVGTARGLARLRTEAIENYELRRDLATNTAWGITRLGDGALLFATNAGLVVERGGERWRLTESDGLPSTDVRSVVSAGPGQALVSTLHGLARVDFRGPRPKVTVLLTHPPSNTSLEARHGRVVLTTSVGGLYTIDDEGAHPVTLPWPDGHPGCVFHALPTRDGAILVGTERGLFALQGDGRAWLWSAEDGLADDAVGVIFETASGRILVGYLAPVGLSELAVADLRAGDRRLRAAHRTKADGLPSGAVVSFAEVTHGPRRGLWAGTSRGLVRLDEQARVAEVLDKARGLVGSDCVVHDLHADTEGGLWVGTTEGVSHVLPEAPPPPAPAPKVFFVTARLGDQPLQDGKRVPSGENDLLLEFAAPYFQGAAEVLFRHRIVGYRDAWSPFGPEPKLALGSLPPGTYRIEVEARGSEGPSLGAAGLRTFHIEKPFYRTTPVLLAFGAVALSVLATLHRLSRRALRRRNAELERTIAERTSLLRERVAELRRANDELLATQKRADRIFRALTTALPGTVLAGKYELHEIIGEGGVGIVFRATHGPLGRPVAIKLFRPQPGNDSAEALARFQREGESAARVDHPNVVRILDTGATADGIPFLVMELLEGHPLSRELRDDAPLPLHRALWILLGVASALEAAHAHGVVHRDVKPENVFLQRTFTLERVKLLDFGLAKPVDHAASGASRLTTEGAILGTPAYMAPERFGRGDDVGPAADVYALGVLAHRLLAGRAPYEGPLSAIISGHLLGEAPPLRERGVPEAVAELVARALAKRPDVRPSAADFVAELRAAQGHERPSSLLEVGATVA